MDRYCESSGWVALQRTALTPYRLTSSSSALRQGGQKIQRHHLSLIKNDDTVCYIVQFAAFGCPVSIKRFPELLIGSDYDGSIPVFRRQLHPPCHGLFHIVIVHIAVALQHISLSQKSLNISAVCSMMDT